MTILFDFKQWAEPENGLGSRLDVAEQLAPYVKGFMTGISEILEDGSEIQSKTRSIDSIEDAVSWFQRMSLTHDLYLRDVFEVPEFDENYQFIKNGIRVSFVARERI